MLDTIHIYDSYILPRDNSKVKFQFWLKYQCIYVNIYLHMCSLSCNYSHWIQLLKHQQWMPVVMSKKNPLLFWVTSGLWASDHNPLSTQSMKPSIFFSSYADRHPNKKLSCLKKKMVPPKISWSIHDILRGLSYMMQDLWDVPEASLRGSHGEWQLAAKWDILKSDRARYLHVHESYTKLSSILLVAWTQRLITTIPAQVLMLHKMRQAKMSCSTNGTLCITAIKFDSSAMTNSCVILTRN